MKARKNKRVYTQQLVIDTKMSLADLLFLLFWNRKEENQNGGTLSHSLIISSTYDWFLLGCSLVYLFLLLCADCRMNNLIIIFEMLLNYSFSWLFGVFFRYPNVHAVRHKFNPKRKWIKTIFNFFVILFVVFF